MNSTILVLIIVIPILLISVGILSFNYISNSTKTRKIINQLAKDNNVILQSKKRESIFNKEERNWLGKRLSYAGFSSPLAETTFILVSIAFGFLSATFINFAITNPAVFAISWVIFSFFPLLVLKKMIDNRLEEFNFGLKVIIDKVTSMMKSGVGFEQALKKSVLTSRSKLTQDIFNIYLNEKDVIGEKKAFDKMFTLIESKELRIFYLTISIGRQSGGKFSNTLEKLRKTLRDQGEIKQEITSSTKEIKIGSYMIIALIVFIYIMMNNALDGAIHHHFFSTANGKLQMLFIILWVSLGLFVNSLMTKVK